MSKQIPSISGHSVQADALRAGRGRLRILMRLGESVGEIGALTTIGLSLVVVNSAELTRLALGADQDPFEPSFAPRSFDWKLLSNGVVIKDARPQGGDAALFRRASAHTLRAQADIAAAFAERLCRGRKTGDRVDIERDMVQLARWMMTRSILDLDDMPDAADEIGAAVTAYATRSLQNAPMPPARSWATRRNVEYRRAIRRLRSAVRRAISERRASGSLDHATFIAAFASAAGANPFGIDDRELSASLTSALMLSLETMLTVMRTVWPLLAESPSAWVRMQDEMEAVLKGRTPQYRDLPRLRYVGQVVREVLRLQPPVAMFSRRLARRLELGDYCVPAGAIVAFNLDRVHRCSDVFERPEVFNPDRFADDGMTAMPPHSYMPLGATEGSASERYALALTHIVLATVAQRFMLKPTSAGHTIAAVRSGRHPEHIDGRTRISIRRPVRLPGAEIGSLPLYLESVRHDHVQPGTSAVDTGAPFLLTCEMLRSAF